MHSRSRLCLLLGLLLLGGGSNALLHSPRVRAEQAPTPGVAALRLGLDPEQVRALLGRPGRVSRQIFSHHALEQWSYGSPHHVRLDFDCPRGQKPRLVNFRSNPPITP